MVTATEPLSRVGLWIVATVVGAVVTEANYLAWFGWDRALPLSYQWWQVTGFVAVLAVVAYLYGRRRLHWAIAVGSGVAMYVAMFYVVPGPHEQMWILAVTLVILGTFVGTLAVAGITAAERRQRAEAANRGRPANRVS